MIPRIFLRVPLLFSDFCFVVVVKIVIVIVVVIVKIVVVVVIIVVVIVIVTIVIFTIVVVIVIIVVTTRSSSRAPESCKEKDQRRTVLQSVDYMDLGEEGKRGEKEKVIKTRSLDVPGFGCTKGRVFFFIQFDEILTAVCMGKPLLT